MSRAVRLPLRATIACVLLLVLSGIAYADNRTENIDLFLVVDKSLSMAPRIGAVKAYIDKSIIQNMLIPGDWLCVIEFYGEAHVVLASTVGPDKQPLERAVDSIRANGHWTDIGNALDKLRAVIDSGDYPNHRKYFMLMTDGEQEAPPTSRYYSPTGSFNHAFLDNTKTIQEKGWKIEILGIGTHTAAEKLAKSLSGGFAQVSGSPTQAEIAQKAGELLGVIQGSDLEIAPVGSKGRSTLTLHLQSSGYTIAKQVSIDSISLSVPGKPPLTIAKGQTITVPAGSTADLSVPVKITGLPRGEHQARVTVTFSGTTTFSPAVYDTKLHIAGGPSLLELPVVRGLTGSISRHGLYWGGGVLLVVALVLLAVVLVRRSTRGSKVTFNLTIEGDLKQVTKFTLKTGAEVLIQDTPMGFRAVTKAITDPVARIVFRGEGLRFEILKPARLKVPTMPTSIMGERLLARTNSGKTIIFHFEPV